MAAASNRWRSSLALQVAADQAEEQTRLRAVAKQVDEPKPSLRDQFGADRAVLLLGSKTDASRFFRTVLMGETAADCWLMPRGSTFYVKANGKEISARRYAWQLIKKRKPPARLVATCKTTSCCNPAHCRPLLAERDNFLSKIPKHKPNACALWQGSKIRRKDGNHEAVFNRSRLGDAHGKSRLTSAARYLWELRNGPLARGMLVYRTCFNPMCLNEKHLYVGNDREDRTRYLRESGVLARKFARQVGNGHAQRKAQIIVDRIFADLEELKRVRMRSYQALIRRFKGKKTTSARE